MNLNEPEFLNAIPFISLAVRKEDWPKSPLITKLLEAAIVGGILLFGTVRELNIQQAADTKRFEDFVRVVEKIHEAQADELKELRRHHMRDVPE